MREEGTSVRFISMRTLKSFHKNSQRSTEHAWIGRNQPKNISIDDSQYKMILCSQSVLH